jgi:hypothetical protein
MKEIFVGSDHTPNIVAELGAPQEGHLHFESAEVGVGDVCEVGPVDNSDGSILQHSTPLRNRLPQL